MQGPFYSTTTYLCNNEVELTDDILNLPGTIEENMSHYYLGYISDEQMPTFWHMGTLTLENGVMRGAIIHQNYGWGYLWHWGDSDGTNVALMRGALIYEDNGLKSNKVSTYSQHFINKCTIANANSENLFRIFFGLMPVKESELTPDGTSMRGYYAGHYNQFFYKNATLTAEQVDQFVNGTYTVTLTGIQIGGGSYSVSFTGTDFDEETRLCKITGISTTYDQEITLYVCISYATTYGMQAYLANNNTKYASRLAPFFAADIVGDGEDIPDQTVLLAPNNMSNKSFILAQANFDAAGTSIDSVQFLVGSPAYTGNLGLTAMGDYSYADGLTIEDFYQHRMVNGTDTITPNWWYATSGIVRDKYIIAGAANSMMAQVVCPLPLSDLLKITALSLNKIETATTSITAPSSFTCSQTYTTAYSVAMYDVDTTDSLGIRKSENYADIAAKLLNWQQPGNDITVDEFTADDIPEWEPPEPEDADSGGDNIIPYDFTNTPLSATNNFTTLYSLTTAQVADFGAKMWAKLGDDNFWHSVGVVFSNDFSINPADMMKYFIFLRYYPFDLSGVSSQTTTGIYIGRSTIPITMAAGIEYPRRIKRNIYTISGGTVDVKLPQYDTGDFFVSDPATQVIVHVPFCGSVQLAASEVYGKTLSLKFLVDLQTGAIMATLSVASNTQYIVATLAGTCGAEIQITANNNIEFLNRIAAVATGTVSTGATMATQGAKIAGAEGAAAGAVAGALTGTVSALAGLPPVTVHKQGATTGFTNYGGDNQAYITIQIVKHKNPDTYAQSIGYLSNKKARIGDLSGYTEMINPDLSGIAAHQDEIAEIYRILQAGFFA